MNRTAVIAIVMIESAGLGVGPLWAAPIEGAPTTESAAPDAESLAAGLARLGAAMTRALPGGSPRGRAVGRRNVGAQALQGWRCGARYRPQND